jgi:hypothetical protein
MTDLPYTVIYMNPLCGNEDEYLSLTVEAKTKEEAMDIAMRTPKFKDKINMEYFDSFYMRVMKLRNRKIGQFFHYKGTPKK